MAYIAPFLPLVASVAQYGFSRYSKSVETQERLVAAQMPEMPKMPAPPSLEELRTLYGVPKTPSLPNISAIQREMPPAPVLGTVERPMPRNGPSIARDAPQAAVQSRPPVSAAVSTSYASEFDTSVACLPCTRGHASAMVTASERLVTAVEAGDAEAAKRNLARIAGEAVVMERFDWTPDKMSRAPAEDRAIIEQIMPQVRELVGQMPTAPLEVVGAWSAVDESLRFARSRVPTGKDLAEVHARTHDAENLANYAEREVLSPSQVDLLLPEQRSATREALNHMRAGRHAMTDAQAMDLPTLERVSVDLGTATVLLTPTPTPEQAREISERVQVISATLDDALRARMKAQVVA